MDPISIALAFAAAQTAVKNIKAAVQTGKDIYSLVGEFSDFFSHADAVHVGNNVIKQTSLTNSQINKHALETAMRSKVLRDAERELKDMLIWSGNGDVWTEMMKERVRLMKERNAHEAAARDAKAASNSKLADIIINSMLGVVSLYIAWMIWAIGWHTFTT